MSTIDNQKVPLTPSQEGDVPEPEVTKLWCRLLRRTVELNSFAVVGFTTVDPRLTNKIFWVRYGMAPREVFDIIWSDTQKYRTPSVEICFKVSYGSGTSKLNPICLVGEAGEFPIFNSEEDARAAIPPPKG